MSEGTAPELLLTPAEVAALFRVEPRTVSRWAESGKLSSLRTPGGHRRFRASEVRRLLARSEFGASMGGPVAPPPPPPPVRPPPPPATPPGWVAQSRP